MNTITIPAGRGARHKARRLAVANPGTHVNVTDKRGVCHYTANALHAGTVYATIYYWQRGNPVHHFITRRHPSAQEIASMLRRRDIARMLDDPSLQCNLCENSVCLPHWPEVDRCKVEQASAAETC